MFNYYNTVKYVNANIMSTEKGIYHWKLGDVSLARICKKVYANVRVVKDEKGLFYDYKGIL